MNAVQLADELPHVELNVEAIVARFLRYVAFDTQSDARSQTYPSTAKQLELSRLLVHELLSLGVADAHLDDHGYVVAHLPGRGAYALAPCVGFLAHVDTAPDASGANVKPQIVRGYDGQDIILNPTLGLRLSPSLFPEMLHYVGEDLIVTDGTTLLGADDKAGVAAIMAAVEYLQAHPEIPHAPLAVAFTLDEEIGRGVQHFDVPAFGAAFAYTIDGGAVGSLEYENFNAAGATVTLLGLSVHPGDAKGRMRNAIALGEQFDALLPQDERPECTEGREGFYHLVEFTGTVSQATLHYIIRDHDAERFQQRKQKLMAVAEHLNRLYQSPCVSVVLEDQYRNMLECIQPHMHVVETARTAMEAAGLKPVELPIRGGTDGANLSWRGLPCPNLFAGGHNFHGPYEYLPVRSLAKASEVIVRIAAHYATHAV